MIRKIASESAVHQYRNNGLCLFAMHLFVTSAHQWKISIFLMLRGALGRTAAFSAATSDSEKPPTTPWENLRAPFPELPVASMSPIKRRRMPSLSSCTSSSSFLSGPPYATAHRFEVGL